MEPGKGITSVASCSRFRSEILRLSLDATTANSTDKNSPRQESNPQSTAQPLETAAVL